MKLERNHVSASFLRKLKNSPRHAFMETVPSPAMEFGSAFHCYLLQPEKFKTEYYVLDDTDICAEIGGAKPRATTKYRDWYTNIPKDKTIIPIDNFAKIQQMSENVNKIRFAKYLLQNCNEFEMQFSFMFDVAEKSCEVKGFFDAISFEKNYIIEVKTCNSLEHFEKDCSIMSYNIQAALYQKAAESILSENYDVFFIAVENSEPYNVGVFQANEQFLTIGNYEAEMLTLLFLRLQELGNFDFGTEIFVQDEKRVQELKLPGWHKLTSEFYI